MAHRFRLGRVAFWVSEKFRRIAGVCVGRQFFSAVLISFDAKYNFQCLQMVHREYIYNLS